LRAGAPVLNETLASVDCRLDQIINIGSHSLFVGQVVDAHRYAQTPYISIVYSAAWTHDETVRLPPRGAVNWRASTTTADSFWNL